MTGMNVLLIAAGDSDQVEPFLALARALGEAGHDATVAAPSRFAAVADDIGVVFAGLDDSAFTLREELGRAGVGGTRSPYLTEPDLQRWLDGLAALTDIDADVVVFTRDAVGASSIADRLGVPAIPAQVVPTAPATAAFTALNAPQWTPRVLHRWTWCYGTRLRTHGDRRWHGGGSSVWGCERRVRPSASWRPNEACSARGAGICCQRRLTGRRPPPHWASGRYPSARDSPCRQTSSAICPPATDQC